MESVTPSRDCWREFDVAVARWRLGDLLAERLPAAALGALIAGCETPSLAQLAAMDGAGWSEIEPLVGRVLDERSRAVPTTREAVKCVADDLLRRMVDGEVTPEEGTERLRRLSIKMIDTPAWQDLGVFDHLAADWDVAQSGVAFEVESLREQMLREANELLARGGVRLR